MNVGELMTKNVRSCRGDDPLSAAAQLMWEGDCGALPVVDDDGKAVAMITDRDICMAAYTRGRPLPEMLVRTAASTGIVATHPDASVDTAESLMRQHQVHRIPVVDAKGKPVGMITMNDLARVASNVQQRRNGITADAVVRTLAAVAAPHQGPPSRFPRAEVEQRSLRHN